MVGAIGTLASIPGQTAGVSVFTDHLSDATGLSRLQLSFAYLMGTGASGLILPRGGRWIDRLGPRVVSFAAVMGLAATITALSFVGPMSTAVGMAVMTLGFGSVRFTGQGLLTLSSRTMVSQWFERRRGLVSSVSNAVMSFFFSLTPALLFLLIEMSDFRWAWRQLALFLIFVVGAIVLVFYRDTPESCGLAIDGGLLDTAETRGTEPQDPLINDPAVTRDEAVRDVRFWALTIPVAAMAVVSTAMTFHIVDFGREVGIGEAEILRIFVPIAMVSIPVTVTGGWLVDSIPPVVVGATMSALQLVMYLTVPFLDDPTLRIVAIAAWGASTGCYAPLTSAALPRIFGRTHLGAIGGAQMSAMVIGSALGPAMFSFIESTTGLYRNALFVSTIFPAIGLVLAVVSARRHGFIRDRV